MHQEFERISLDMLRSELADRNMRYTIETYGCQMNVRDSEIIAGMLDAVGMKSTEDRSEADLILFNTCCVRDHAEKRLLGNIGALRPLKEAKPGLVIGVCGCMMQQKEVAEKLYRRFPFVDIIFGTHMLDRLPDMLKTVFSGERVLAVSADDIHITEGLPSHRPGGSSAFVNIMYGCNNYCTYCIVPYVRGPERSRTPASILDEIRSLAASGYSEITLLGQNVNSYGLDRKDDTTFPELLKQVSEVDGIRRIRFMTSHPKDLSDELIRAIATLPNVCHHVHLPVQSGSNSILRRMNRKYTREQYLAIVKKLHEAIPDVELTTDIIVGFPGETEEDFLETMSLVADVGYAAAFTFKYSPRQGTSAAKMSEQISEKEKQDRLQRLNALQLEMTQKNNEKYIGVSGEVLVEGCEEKGERLAFGKFSNFKMVYFPGTPDLIGTYQRVVVERTRRNSLVGRMEGEDK